MKLAMDEVKEFAVSSAELFAKCRYREGFIPADTATVSKHKWKQRLTHASIYTGV